tara:strand:- start:416 stop:805 length:390 start_codon:yes stop_codon:yes gene_type:complete
MSLASDLRTILTGHTALTDLVGTRISPYLRNRDDVFPAVTFDMPNEELTTDTAGNVQASLAECNITAHSRTFDECESIGTAILGAIAADSDQGEIKHIMPGTISRSYDDPFDGSADLVYRWTLDCTLKG